MYRRFGILSLMLMASSSILAEQASLEPLGPPDGSTEITATTTESIKPATQAVEQAGFSKGSVFRSAFTSAVENREPTDSLEAVSGEQNQLYFFTELRDMSGQTARHRWEYAGKVMAEVEFNVKGPRWRVWSSKSFVPGWAGNWKVSVVNGAGDVITEKNFTYETASAAQSTGQISEPVISQNPQ
ncbi:MAG: DUF2914 domain-containing protein [Gammaproteobacteria bacterium]|nr:DUF2914 domain-containing protein [Gammaproteobacteria bacterium]